MINLVLYLSITASHYGQLADELRDALCGFPDAALKDIGLARSDLPVVVGGLVSQHRNASGNAADRFDWSAVWRSATILRLPETILRLTLVAAAAVSAVFALSSSILA